MNHSKKAYPQSIMNTKNSSLYSLHKSRAVLRWAYNWYKKNGKKLSAEQRASLEDNLEKLDQALLKEDREGADVLAKKVEEFGAYRFKKSIFEYGMEIVVALVLALIIATLVRQMWFEPYEIPTGSMRPTFKEQDHLTVSKTAFGINVPLETKHFYFDPNLVQRTGIVIWSGDNVPLPDVDSTYFGLFPYKKRYIKRLMGKPGDTLYFYGGKIYAMDKNGNFLPEYLNQPILDKLENIPFLTFEGNMSVSSAANQIYFNQMHKPIGRLSVNNSGELKGEVYNGSKWVYDNPSKALSPHNSIETYSDFWGMRNFAMARLLTKKELQEYTNIDTSKLEDAELYLELRHTPSLNYPKPTYHSEGRATTLSLTPYTTAIPLQKKHLDAIMDNMYTARFVIHAGRGTRYSANGPHFTSGSPYFAGVPDGTYEFYYGRASKIGWGGISNQVPPNNPLYSHEAANVQKLYNLGIDFETAYSPRSKNQSYFPHRYAYFREGDLYLLGSPVLKKDDPTLKAFIDHEMERERASTPKNPYAAFIDHKPPLKNGEIDKEFMKTFGLNIPENQYLVLGDNHAMSADSRIFGFLPQENLQGVPSLIIWPPGPRWGPPAQKPYPIFTVPRLIVWGIVLLVLAIWYAIHRYNLKKPIFKKIK